MNKVSCIFCKKQLSVLGLSGHVRMVHEGKNDFQLAGNLSRKGKKSWNSGLNKTDPKIKASAAKISETMQGRKGHSPSPETRRKISETGSKRKSMGGYRPGSGIGKSGWYRGIWCDSTWELAFIIWCQQSGKIIQRNTETFIYSFEGKTRKYLPDFLVDGELVEIKGRRKTEPIIEAKLQAANGRVKILFAAEMKPILESVKHLQPLEKLYGG